MPSLRAARFVEPRAMPRPPVTAALCRCPAGAAVRVRRATNRPIYLTLVRQAALA